MAAEVERVVLQYDDIELARVEAKPNPITGQHVELTLQPIENVELDMMKFKEYLTKNLPRHMLPRRIRISPITVGHRFKRG